MAHVHSLREAIDRMLFLKALSQIVKQSSNSAAVTHWLDGLPHVLGLTTVSMGRNNESTSNQVRGLGSKIPTDEMKAKIQARSSAGSGENIPFVDVQDIWINNN